MSTPPPNPESRLPDVALACPPRVAWAVTATGVTLVDGRSGRVERLRYPEAAVWDSLARDRGYVATVDLLVAVARVDRAGATVIVDGTVSRLTELGFLVRVTDDNG